MSVNTAAAGVLAFPRHSRTSLLSPHRKYPAAVLLLTCPDVARLENKLHSFLRRKGPAAQPRYPAPPSRRLRDCPPASLCRYRAATVPGPKGRAARLPSKGG